MNSRLFLLVLFLISAGCSDSNSNEEDTKEATTPVTVTNICIGSIEEIIEFNAVSQFQKKTSVKTTITGYVNDKTVSIGSSVVPGQLLFQIMTREAAALHNNISTDTLMNFSGLIGIKAQVSGIVTSLNHQLGDFVQEGDELVVISEQNSLVFLLQVPFEMTSWVKVGADCEIILPGNTVVPGKITGALPEVDPVSQTQQFIVKPMNAQSIPENLVAKIRIIKIRKENTTIIPKTALLSDESQSEFWVMRLINDSMAIKTVVEKGIDNKDSVEIVSPVFDKTTRLIMEGNYGLADTAKINIRNK
jgi:multidrug resistance efflux pump